MAAILFQPQCVKMLSTKSQLICPGLNVLTHLPLDKMAAISQTILSDAFLWMKSFVFWSKFHWGLFPEV